MKKTIALAGIVLALLAVTVTASREGWGIPQPVKKPLSLREGSARLERRQGHHGTRYFVGGGLHRGK